MRGKGRKFEDFRDRLSISLAAIANAMNGDSFRGLLKEDAVIAHPKTEKAIKLAQSGLALPAPVSA